ncbi:uncharacterized protein LOC123208953 [Mangifera indica]|uniref:uncharacterized protein LOC123208953 n=1 Tax=Mangifera indica TaxID=29780 RepID=UPI001CFAF5DC|nr:uncharacterized protein LOC123208953 [Mangifera indica]
MKSCDKFKIFNSEPNSLCLDHKVHFRDLEVLELKNISFGKIWDSQLSTSSYQNLTHLTLFECDKIKYVFPLSIAKSLQQLQYLELTSCKVLEIIVTPEEGTEAAINFFFPQVSTVKLQYLPRFTDFYPRIHTSEWPKLRELVVEDCPKFNMFTSEPNSLCLDQKINHDLEIFQVKNGWKEISWRSQFKKLEISYYKSVLIPLWLLQRFENLTCLFVDGCHELVNLTTPSIARSLVQLRGLKISCCEMLMEILEIEEDATTEIVFENLNKLSFECLENLACFCSGNYTFNFHSLEELNIANCPNIKTFCRGILSTPKLQEISYEGMKVKNKGNDLNKTIQKLYKKKNQDISLDLNFKFKTFHHDNSTEIAYNQHPTSFYQNLTHLFLLKCGNIKYVFPSSIAKILHQLQQLRIQNCKALEEIVAKEEGANAVVHFVFPNITLLKFEDLPELIAFYPGIYALEMPKLKELVIKDCTKYASLKENNVKTELNILAPKSIFLDNKVHFRDLEVLELKNISFGKIWDSQLSTSSYQNLTHLTLFECDKIKYVFPLSIAKSLQQLQYLELTSCKVLEIIVTPEEGTEAAINFFFPQVSTVKLQYLPRFTDFYPRIHTSEWPKLRELVVEDCPKFNMFTSEPNSLCLDQKINHDLEIFQVKNGWKEISWRSQFKKLEISYYKSVLIPLWLLQRFENLTCLFVDGCHELVNLTTPSIARSLVQLRGLKISCCEMLMEILEIEEDATTEIVFENLNKLSFECLENLACFCSGNYTFNFHSLEELNIANCPNIKTFCRGILSTPKLQEISYEGMKVKNKGNDLNKTIQKLYKKKNQDISLDLNFKFKTFHHDNSTEIAYNQHPTSFYQNLTHLFLLKCGNIKYVFPSSIAKILHQLQQLRIQNCKALEEIVAKEEGANAVVHFVFPNITLLKFEDLPELIAFYPGIYALEMPKLKELVIKDCTKYASLKENNVKTELNILAPKSIFLDNKINFNLEVFELDDGETNICWQSQSRTLTINKDISALLRLLQRFENVRELRLYCSLYSDIKSLCDLPNLEILEVDYCYKLMSLVPFSGSFQNLKVLKVSSCDGLMKLITPSVATSLVQLRELRILNCEMLTEIVENEGDAATCTKIVFNNLNKLSLIFLESLTYFCSGNYSFSFSSLEELIIEYCPNLEIFCQGSICTPKLDRVIYKFEDRVIKFDEAKIVTVVEIGDNDLNTTIQQEYKNRRN